MTRQRTRLTINFNTRQHQILRRYFPRSLLSPSISVSPPSLPPHPPTPTASAYPSASATVRLMPRFTDDNHPRRSPESLDLSHGSSRIIILLLIHGIANRGRRAAPRRRPGEATGKKNHAAKRDTIGAFGGCRLSDATRG